MKTITIEESQRHLALVWFSGAGFIFFIVLLQTILGTYGDKAKDAWSWLMPTIIPTLSLIIGVLVSDSISQRSKDISVDHFVFKLSFYLSIAYVVVVSLTVLLSVFSEQSPIELMKLSNLWLAPFQGLVSAALGAFFISRK